MHYLWTKHFLVESVFLTISILNTINEDDKKYKNSPSLQQDLYQKNFKCFRNYLPIHTIPNILNEDDIDLAIDEAVNNKDFENSNTEIETKESIEELKYPKEYEDGGIIILHDLTEKGMNDPRVQVMFRRSRHINLAIFIINQDYYELSKKTIRAKGNIYHIFKPKNFFDVRNIYQHKSSTDMALNEFKLLTSTCWNEKYQPLAIDKTKNNFTGRYRLGLKSILIPDSSTFQNK